MSKVNMPELRKEVVSLIEKNRDKVASFEAKDDYSVFTFCGKEYVCEVEISPTWFGVDLDIDTTEGQVWCGYEENNDGYGDDNIQLEVYGEIIKTVQAIFDGRITYLSTPKYAYTVRKDLSGTYYVRYWRRKKFLWITYHTGWVEGVMSEAKYGDLNLTSLKVLS